MAHFKQVSNGSCCDCVKQLTACAGCRDCDGNVIVTMETNLHANYGSKCGLQHPFVEFPRRYFRKFSVEFWIELKIEDFATEEAVDVAVYDSRCTMTVSSEAACNDAGASGEVVYDSHRLTNWFSGLPLTTSEVDDKSSGRFVDVEPWNRADPYNDCWDADQFFARGAAAAPTALRYIGGTPIGNLLSCDYDGEQVDAIIVPEPVRDSFTETSEIWERKNGAPGAPDKGWGWNYNGTMRLGIADVIAVRSARGRCSVRLDDEYTTSDLKAFVQANLVQSGWGNGGLCCEEALSQYEDSYEYSFLQYRFRYDERRYPRVRIGYKVFEFGRGQQAETQYVDSPGDGIAFTLLPAGTHMCVNLVSAEVC